MQETGRAAHFFISANTPQGLVCHSEQLYSAKDGWRTYILKGGPGSGKSLFIKTAGAALQRAGLAVEYIHCASDPDGFDGLIAPAKKLCVLDGSAPHTVEPKYPGAVESIENLGECCDEAALYRQRGKILTLTARSEAVYDRVFRFLTAASSLRADVARQALECCDLAKIDRYAARLAKREFPPCRRPGHETRRYLTAITPEGVRYYPETLDLYPHLFVIEDEFGLSRLLLNRLRAHALAAGCDVIGCACPLGPGDRLEHLFLPGLSTAFVTSNRFHPIDRKGCRHIHIRRFLDNDTLRQRRQRIRFNRRAVRELLDEAVRLLGEARAQYGLLSDIYGKAADLGAVRGRAQALAARFTAPDAPAADAASPGR